jgi:hypothetical protein
MLKSTIRRESVCESLVRGACIVEQNEFSSTELVAQQVLALA